MAQILILFLFSLSTAIASIYYHHGLLNVVSVALYVAHIRQLWKLNPATTLLLAPIFILHWSVVVSLVGIENGAFMKEMGAVGAPSGAISGYCFTSILVSTTAFLICNWTTERLSNVTTLLSTQPKSAISSHILELLPASAILLGVVYLVLIGVLGGFPLIAGFDRFGYRSQADPITLNLLNLKYLVSFFLGVAYLAAKSRAKKAFTASVFVLYIAVSFLYADKFFNIIISTTFFIAPVILGGSKPIPSIAFKYLAPASVPVMAAVAVTYYIYSGSGELSFGETMLSLSERVAGQGQLWYLSFTDSPKWLSFDGQALRLNLQNLLESPPALFAFEHKLASFYFVEKYSPYAMYRSFINNAGWVTPTMAYESYALVKFGFVGLALSLIFLGFIIGLVWAALRVSIHTSNPYAALLPAYMATQVVVLTAQGTLYNVFSLSSLKAYTAILAAQILAFFVINSLNSKYVKISGEH